jgi:hypothetical protein
MREWTAVKRWREKRGEGRFPVEKEGRRERCRDEENGGGRDGEREDWRGGDGRGRKGERGKRKGEEEG